MVCDLYNVIYMDQEKNNIDWIGGDDSIDYRKSIAVKPIAPWFGGKSRLAKTIIERIDAIPHICYAEPFMGMGGIFLRMATKSKCEVINDYNKDISNLFRIVQRHHDYFIDMIKFQITSRDEFDRMSNTDPNTLTDLERASRFLYLQNICFGGLIKNQSYSERRTLPSRLKLDSIENKIKNLHTRLDGVNIECLNYSCFIKKYDSKDTLFYLDPPYYDRSHYYGSDLFDNSDFEKISDLLNKIEGRFILSLNDVPEIRDTFKDFNLDTVNIKYSISNKWNEVSELLISN